MTVLDVDLDVKPYLHINSSTTTYDAQLRAILAAAESAIAQKCGPLSATSVTERVNGGRRALVLSTTPVISLTSVTPVGSTAYTVTDLQVDPSSGVVEWVYGYPCFGFAPGRYDVVYSAGRASVPEDLKLAIREYVRYLWETQRGGPTRPGIQGSESDYNAGLGAGIERVRRVQDLIRPYTQVGN